MIHLPTIDLITIPKSNENEINKASLDFRKFKLKKITKMNHSL